MKPQSLPPLDVLRRFAPGTTLRDGAELIFRHGTGVLMVLGTSSQIDDLCTGGFRFADVPVTAQRIAELAKMDGGIVIDDTTNTISRANVHFIPDPRIPTDETGTRFRTADRLASQTGLPVLVTGGAMPDVESSEAAIMRNVLEGEYGVAVRWAEERSRNTRENAQRSVPLLKDDGVALAVLVTHAVDMPRARAEFMAAGMETIAAPTGLTSPGPLRLTDFVPSAAALQASHDALYEILADVVRSASGR